MLKLVRQTSYGAEILFPY